MSKKIIKIKVTEEEIKILKRCLKNDSLRSQQEIYMELKQIFKRGDLSF